MKAQSSARRGRVRMLQRAAVALIAYATGLAGRIARF